MIALERRPAVRQERWFESSSNPHANQYVITLRAICLSLNGEIPPVNFWKYVVRNMHVLGKWTEIDDADSRNLWRTNNERVLDGV